MINFWVISGLLTVLACLFLLLPLFRSRQLEANKKQDLATREKENIAIFKDRLAELELEKSKNMISESAFLQRKADLETALVNDVPVQPSLTDSDHITTSKIAFLAISFSIIFVCGFSYYFYQINGAKPLVDKYHSMKFDAEELQKAKELAKAGDMNALLDQLYQKLKAAPEKIEGWQLLARSAMNAQNYGLAEEAYSQIISLAQGQESNNLAPLYGLLAQAQYYAAEGKMSNEVKDSIAQAFSMDKNELNALGLLAIDAFTNQRFAEAKKHWLTILEIYPDHPAYASIEAGIKRANAELGVAVDEGLKNVADTSLPGVLVQVSLDPSIAERVSPDDVVYVVAKQVSGTAVNKNIPLAVSRHRVADLPIAVMLDDSFAMAPIAKISMADTVVVVARVSKTGNPVAQKGDFEAMSSDVSTTSNERIELMIQSEVK